jgi:beta-galactosidase
MLRFTGSIAIFALLAAASTETASPADLPERTRIITSFDEDWRFLKADALDKVPDADNPDFDDSAWRTLNVPHDWSIEGSFDEKNPTRGAGGFLPAGVGWYRKHFTLPAEYAQRCVFIEFDGVMANSDVWINGHQLGKRPYGYVSFRYELTCWLNFGENKSNVLVVRADNSAQPASRWYSGAGIYRHVRLVATHPVHLDQWSTFITTPKITSDQALVHLQTTVINQSNMPRKVWVKFNIIAPDDQTVGTAVTWPEVVPVYKTLNFQQDIIVKNPKLWDLDHPALYRALVEVRAGNSILDDKVASFGIREIRFEAPTGFWLNGKNLKIKGVCLHHDGGAVGAAVPLSVWERRLETLKQIGVNGIRTAHNPPAPEFLDLCDSMGLLVMDEFFDCWTAGKNRYDYHLFFNDWSKTDARDTVRRDRNHPSVILYSVGNEIHDTSKAEMAQIILKGLVEVCHENDPTRPVTQALFRPNVSHDFDNGLADMLDVIGTNYRDSELIAAYQAKPTRKIIGTEQGHDRKIWLTMRDNPPEAGQFLWTGIDYLGESRAWPIVVAGSGLLDLTGKPKPMAYERQSWWSDKPMVRIVRRVAAERGTSADPGFEPLNRLQSQFLDWTPQDTSPHDEKVEVYSNCDDVELMLNDKSLGSKPRNADDSPRAWKVQFEPGVIKALGKNKDQVVASDELKTSGKPAKIVLTADRDKLSTDWDDVCFVTAAVADENGVLIPGANDLISFKITGPGVIAAVDNGDRSSHEPFQAAQRRAFQGRCVAIIKAGAPSGRIVLTASAAGLGESSINIETVAPDAKTPAVSGRISPAASPGAYDPRLPTLFIIGDSTVKNGSGKGDSGLWGWGYPIAAFFDKTKINVQNRALGGRSSRTFQTEGLWDKVLAAMKPGDFVMMQFGHNDGGSLNTGPRPRASLKGNGEETQEVVIETTGKNEVIHTYGWYMRKYIADAKAKGVVPIVLSPIPRNMWTDGKVNRASKDYGKWATEAAKDGGAFFIDLNEIVAKHYDSEGSDKVAAEYFTEKDHTHTTAAGAKLNAACVIEGLKELKDCPLLKYLSDAPERQDP